MRDLKSRLIFDKQGIDKLLMDAIGTKYDMKVTKIKFFLESKQDGLFEKSVISRLEVEGYHNSILSIYDEEDLLSGKIEAALD
jgi:hypothetical protein